MYKLVLSPTYGSSRRLSCLMSKSRPAITCTVNADGSSVRSRTFLHIREDDIKHMSGKSNVFTLRANNTISVASLAPFYLVVMWMSGIITPDGVWRALLLVPPYLAGQWVGVRLFHIVSETVFRKFSLFLLISKSISTWPLIG